jgi:thiol:disulfide interchange protein
MKKLLFVIVTCCVGFLFGQNEDLIDIGVGIENSNRVSVVFETANDSSYIYASSISFVSSDDSTFTIIEEPVFKEKYDEAFGENISYISGKGRYLLNFSASILPPFLTVNYQACVGEVCYLPTSVELPVASDSLNKSKTKEVVVKKVVLNDGFQEASRSSGYMNAGKFMSFLTSDKKQGFDKIIESSKNQWWFFLVAIIGGFLLNLTPCVLPLIPINLAIIGAGSNAKTKSKGFLLGGVYGLGMAVVYGGLGGVVVLTGSQFGALNASPIFNIIIGAIFVVLALGMFDVFSIDFSKYQNSSSGIAKKTGYLPIFILGGITALLAGACVAPVVIAVILVSSNMYSNGNYVGILFPLLLGVGMALPWPFAGGGMAFLPKPGKWMVKIKYIFGVLIFIMAFYYIYVGVKIFIPKHDDKSSNQVETVWYSSIDEGFEVAAVEQKPVLIYFTADWCKNCLQMKKSTFKNENVISELDKFVKIKFDATVNNPENQVVLDKYNVIGLPEYIIFEE